MPKVKSREYKVMLDHRVFGKRKPTLDALRRDLHRGGERCRIDAEGKFDSVDKRTIRFLDTKDFTFNRHNLIFRRRPDAEDKTAEFTLKCRTEDRYIAEGLDLRPAKGLKPQTKFEEDIAAPFRSRFSRSVTIGGEGLKRPKTVSDAEQLFPIFGRLRCNGKALQGNTRIVVVEKFTAHERVYKGRLFDLGAGITSTAAVILWSHSWQYRIVAAELSFRYGNVAEEYGEATAEAAFHLFATLQKLNWCLPGASTTTQFAYGG